MGLIPRFLTGWTLEEDGDGLGYVERTRGRGCVCVSFIGQTEFGEWSCRPEVHIVSSDSWSEESQRQGSFRSSNRDGRRCRIR